MPQIIKRMGPAPRVETRADGKKVIRGIAPVYYNADDPGTEFKIGKNLVERVRPGAASGATAEGADVRSFFNHDPSIVLGRTKSGTLTLEETARGLEFEVEPPDTTAGRDALTSIERGDVSGSSFMFWVERQSFEEPEEGPDVRWLDQVNILEVGPVTFPAYPASTSEAGRNDAQFAEVRDAYEAWKDDVRRVPTTSQIGRELIAFFTGKPDTFGATFEQMVLPIRDKFKVNVTDEDEVAKFSENFQLALRVLRNQGILEKKGSRHFRGPNFPARSATGSRSTEGDGETRRAPTASQISGEVIGYFKRRPKDHQVTWQRLLRAVAQAFQVREDEMDDFRENYADALAFLERAGVVIAPFRGKIRRGPKFPGGRSALEMDRRQRILDIEGRKICP